MVRFLKNNTVAILVITIFLAVYGTIALFRIPKEAQPSINIPYYYITFSYLGADPASVEEQVIIPLEQKLKTIPLVKNITSSSYYNFGTILVEFDKRKQDVDATNEIKAVIDQVFPTLPDGVKLPILKKVDVTDTPVYAFSVVGSVPTQILYEQVKSLEESIKSIPGVAEVHIIGKPIKEMQIFFDSQTLGALNLDFSYVVNQLKTAFVKFPVNKKMINGQMYAFEVINYDVDMTGLLHHIENYPLLTVQGKVIYLRDIARVYIGYARQDKMSFIITDITYPEAKNALSFQIKKSPGYSLGPLIEAITAVLDTYKTSHPELEFVETLSQEQSIKQTYGTFIQNFWQTGLLVFIVVLLFLGGKSSFVIFVSFFVVYLTNFIYLKTVGYSFNNIVSFALILVLGIMVDNLIVITQGIVTGLQKYTGNIWSAIGYSLRTYGKAVIFGTLTTIVIFVPLYFGLSGVMGEYIRSLPVTVISNLTISLLVTLLILPVIASFVFRSSSSFVSGASLSFLQRIGERIGRMVYYQTITKRRSFGVVMVFIIFFVGILSLIPLGVVKFSFMGNIDSNNVWINITYAPGISLQENQQYTAKIIQASMRYFQTAVSGVIQKIAIDLGQSYSIKGGGTIGSHVTSFTLKLVDAKHRSITSYELVEKLQNELIQALKQRYSFIQDMTVFTVQAGGGVGKPVAFTIFGDDYQAINNYIQTILPEVIKIPGIFNVGVSLEYTNGKIVYVIDEAKVKELGANSMSVVMNMMALQNNQFTSQGILIHEFSEFGSEIIPLKAFLTTRVPFEQIKIGNYFLDQLLKKQQLKPEIISIVRTNGKRGITVQADKFSSVALADIISAIDTIIKNHPLPSGMEYKSGGDIQQLDQSVADIQSAMILGLVLMLLVLIIQFNSFKYSILIIFSVILSFMGIVGILALTGFNLTFPAMIAIFGVFGVGVNQMLILLEDFNYFYKKKYLPTSEAFQQSIRERFVPIFLTNATTIIGLIILAFKDELFGSMAIAFIGGLFASVVISLFFLPALMNLFTKRHYSVVS